MKKILRGLLFAALSTVAYAQTPKTQLTGSMLNPDGSGFNGNLYLSITQASAITSANSCGGPVQVVPTMSLNVVLKNGTMTSWTAQGSTTVNAGAPKIFGSDCTIPAGIPYNAILRDAQGNIMFNTEWLITGTTQDIGTVPAAPQNPLASYANIVVGTGTPTGACSAQDIFLQTDATAGASIWTCINGAYVQQSGSTGGASLAIGNTVTGGSNSAVLYVDSGGKLANDVTNLSYNAATHTLNVTNLNVTNALALSITGNAATATTATQLAGPITTCTNQAATGILPNGNAAACLPIIVPVGGAYEVQARDPATGGLRGSGIFANTSASTVLINGVATVQQDPSAPLGIATKQYVDASVAGIGSGISTLYVQTGPAAGQVITQPDGTLLEIKDAGTTTGVTVLLDPHVNFTMTNGIASVTSPDGNTTFLVNNSGVKLAPGVTHFIQLAGQLAYSYTTITANATIGAAGEYVTIADGTSGAITATLPAANTISAQGASHVVYKKDASGNAITVTAAAGDNIAGAATYVLSARYASVSLTSDGNHTWYVASASLTGTLSPSQMPAFSGDITTSAGSTVTTLATVNSGPGACGDATHYCVPTTNGKGLVTSQTSFPLTNGISFQTNSIVNSNQALLNLNSGPGIQITEQNGKVTFVNTYLTTATPLGIIQGVDWPPTVTTAMNDEFTDPTFNTNHLWTVINQGSNTVTDNYSLLNINCAAHSGDNWVGVYQLEPATPFAVTAKIKLTGVNANFYYGGLAFRDSSTSKVVSFHITNGGVLTLEHWTNQTSSGTVVSTLQLEGVEWYFQAKDDGVNFTFYFSKDGVNFLQAFQESRTAFLATPDSIGYIAGSSNATYPMALGSDWFRRTL